MPNRRGVTVARISVAACLAALVPSVPAVAQITPTKPYLVVFHICEGTLCTDPKNHVVYLAESGDGATFSMVPGWTPFAGSVPDVIQRGRTLYIYTASSLVARYDLDTGASDRVPVRVTGLPSGVVTDWVDPSLYVDEEGLLVLFMMYAPPAGGDPARCPSGVTSCTKQFLSATEVAGSNGTQFTVDPGTRATTTIFSSTLPMSASDPDIFFDATQYVMYMSHGPSTSVWTSPTLRGTYTQSTILPGGLLSDGRGGIPAGRFDSATSRYWTYTHRGQGGPSVIRRAVHANLSQQLGDSAWTAVITGSNIGLGPHISVESPGFAVLTSAPPTEPSCSMLTTPGPLTAAVVGSSVTLVWGGVGAASSYVVEAGSSPGSASLVTSDTGSTVTSGMVRNVAPGTYQMRIRARNACGTSPPSNDVTVVVR